MRQILLCVPSFRIDMSHIFVIACECKIHENCFCYPGITDSAKKCKKKKRTVKHFLKLYIYI